MKQGGFSAVLVEKARHLQYKALCDPILNGSMIDSTVVMRRRESMCWCEGIVTVSSSVIVELSVKRVIEVDVHARKLLSVGKEDLSGIEHNQVLDLSDDGERWEGDVLNGQPYGWGVEYDSENRMAYEGFRLGEVNVCYGIQYYSDLGVIEYKGEWFEGKRWGRGAWYNRTGEVMFDGTWIDGGHEVGRRAEVGEDPFLHSCIEELTVSSNCCNEEEWTALDLSFMFNLRELKVGNECFMYVQEMKLTGLKNLESVTVGDDCFNSKLFDMYPDHRCHFHLKNCERIKELKIGCDSFALYSTIEIECVDSLEVIEIGGMNEEDGCFIYSSLELKSDSRWME